MIPFNKPAYTGKEHDYIIEAVKTGKISGNGVFADKCCKFLKEKLKTKKVMLTPSCTHALEMSAILIDIKQGDEVIMPSFTFTSTANAFVMRGAKIVFVDIRKDTMNMDEKLVEAAVTKKTRAIAPVHYAGVSCEMDEINAIAKKKNLKVVEDAAQGVMSAYKGTYLGALSDIGCFSFHETKNYTCGEGGAIILNDESYIEKAEIITEKGTNRNKFFRGEVDKYTWVDIGSSYLLSELDAAYLWAQLEKADEINNRRIFMWELYNGALAQLAESGQIETPYIPGHCKQNGHMFYIKVKDIDTRTKLIGYLKQNGIMAIFHYIPLHSSPAGKKYGRFNGKDVNTTKESERILRLPMYYGLTDREIDFITCKIREFFGS